MNWKFRYISYITSYSLLTGSLEPTNDHPPTSVASLLGWLEHHTGIARSQVQTQLKSWFFQALICNCLSCNHNCEDHSLLDTIPVFTSRLSVCVYKYPSNHTVCVTKQQTATAYLTVFRFCIIMGIFGDYSLLFALFHAINFVGVTFVSIPLFASVIKRFVWWENPERELKL